MFFHGPHPNLCGPYYTAPDNRILITIVQFQLCSELHSLCEFITKSRTVYIYLIQNSQAVKKVCGPQKGYGEKRCEIQGGGQEMAVMVG